MTDRPAQWDRFKKYWLRHDEVGLSLDVSRMPFDEGLLDRMREPMGRAMAAMRALEGGDIANPSERRMVGHYWLRATELAPSPELRREIEDAVGHVRQFAADVHSGVIVPQRADGFFVVLVVGIGGSALGPQLVADALGTVDDELVVRFVDNTDPDGVDRTVAELGDALAQTLTIVISKSGGTVETRNGMLELAEAYRRAGLTFSEHAVAVTMEGSELHRQATTEQWRRTFPMWDWVGGRTSVLSPVGLLPAALQGINVAELLDGARAMDVVTREEEIARNPAALLATMWHHAGNGRGDRQMVVLPYRDRLVLLGRYLQQLVMESLGKTNDRAGKEVHQGLTVFGNKGSTDQHAYVQQLRDGRDDFFVTFLSVLNDRDGRSIHVAPDTTSGDYLHAFRLGTRQALAERGRGSISITLDQLDARSMGALIALFERAVGLYAELINVNAYDQPGVEAGKGAAEAAIALQRRVLGLLRQRRGQAMSAEQAAVALGESEAAEDVYHLLLHAAANPSSGVATASAEQGPGAEFVAG